MSLTIICGCAQADLIQYYACHKILYLVFHIVYNGPGHNISYKICAVWSDSSQVTLWVAKDSKLPKLHKRPYKARFIANSSSCTTTVLSKLLTSCLTAVKKHWIRNYDTVYERDGINYFWSIKNSNDVLNKFKSKNFQASELSAYDFSTLYTTLPHYLIKDKLIDLINRTFIRENTQYLACNEECAFFHFWCI